MRYLFTLAFALSTLLGLSSPTGYLYYKRLTTQESQISVNNSSLIGFPVLVRITDNDLKHVNYGGKVRSSKGYDITFTTNDGNTLVPFQLESYDSLTGSLVTWVRLPSISATTNTDFYLFFGNASVTTNMGSKSTWDANYKAVYHLNADIADWTNNAANLTNSATTNFSPGLAADGQRIGSGAYLSRAATAGLQITGDFTLEAWMFPNSLISGSNENIVLSSSSNNNGVAATNINYCLSIVGSGSNQGALMFKWQYGNNSDEIVTSTLPISNTVVGWHYVSVVRDVTLKQVRFYFDGNQLGSAVSFSNLPTGGASNSFLIGKNLADPGRTIDAGFDEVRISNTIRNPEWIQAAYNSYKSGSTFISYSPTFSVSPTNFCFCSVNMSGFTQIGTLNSHTYFRSNQKASWQKADSIASSLGGHLVSITSLAENTFLTLNLLLSNAWTGLNDSINEGSFVWSSGEAVSYTNWGVLQPDNIGNSDYALFSSVAGLWDDQQNSQQFYIIEFDCLAATSVVANAGPDQSVCGASATLSATALPASAFGQWSILTGSGAIANTGNSTTTVTGLGYGANSFIWKVANGSCATTLDTVVLLTDTVKPIITCPGDLVINNSPGFCTGIASWVLPAFSDNCAGVTLSQGSGLASGSAFPLGVTKVEYKAVDTNGNSSICSFNVTVNDNEMPRITCPGNLVVNNDPGACGAVVSGISPINASDNCNTYSISYNITGATSGSGSNDASGTFFNLGTSQIRYIITDAVGNAVACSFSVTVNDNTAPVFTSCPSDITVYASSGTCTAVANWTAPIAVDNCPGLTITQTSGLANGSSFPIGSTGIKYLAQDAAGLASTCVFNVIVLDTISPTILSCPSNITIPAAGGTCSATVSWTNPGVADNCTGATISQIAGPSNGSTFPLGSTTVTYKAIDAANLTKFCAFNVTVVDTTKPIISNCPSNLSITNSTGLCAAVVSWIPPNATDNCGSASLTQIAGLTNGSSFPIGTSSISYQATDAAGNNSICNFNITVTDAEKPVITCPINVAATTDLGFCTATVNGIAPLSSTDNCSISSIVYTVSGATTASGSNDASGTLFNIGASQVVYTISDAAGNSSSCNFTVVVTPLAPTSANAGTDQFICSTTASTAANTALIGTGSWSVISGTGVFANSNSPTTTVTGLSVGANVFRWTISTSTCSSSFDDVTLFVDSPPSVSNAGSNQIICSTNTTLTANIPSIGSGNWTLVSGLGAIATPSSATTSVSALGIGPNIFKWTITNGSCPASESTVSITVDQSPSNSNAGPNQNICTTTTNLAANTPVIGNGTWSIVSGSGVFSNSNSPTSSISNLNLGTTVLRWTISNGSCTPSSSDVSITVTAAPTTANAGLDQVSSSTCGSTFVSLNANTPTSGSGIWSIVSGGAGSFSNANSPNSIFSGTPGVLYVLRWTISNSCGTSSDDVSVQINLNPSTSLAGADQTNLCGVTSTTLAANTPTVGTGSWSIVSGAGGSFSLATNPTATFTGTLGTTYVLRWTIANAPCTSSTDDVTITFNNNPTTANAGVDQTNLCGVTSTTLAANTPSVGTGTWSIVSGAGGSFSLATNPTATFTGTLGTTYVLRWTIANSPCTSSTDDVAITFNNNPTTANGGADQINLCGVTSTTLAANTPTVGTGTWSIVSGAGGSFSLATNPSATFSGNLGTAYVLRWTIANAPCTSSTDDVTITFNNNPTTANAGADQTNLCGVTSTTLAANTPTIGTGSWSIVSGAGGSFSLSTNPSATFTGTLGTTYVLRWTIANAPCTSSTDDVTITFNNNPTTANTGADQTNLCGVTSTTLAANTPTVGTGTWSIVSGAGGSFSLATNPSATFTGTLGTTYVLRWTIANSPCTSSTDDVTITFNNNPTTANAGADQTNLCGVISTTLAANTPTVGTGSWSIVSGAGGTFSLTTNPSATFTGTLGTTYVLRWTIANAPCTSSTDDVTITFNNNPTTANAGADQTNLCGVTSTTLAANTPTVGTGTWSIVSGAGGSFSLATNPTATFTGTLGTTYVLRWTIANAPCVNSSDDMTITFGTNPSIANAGLNQNICASTTALAANIPTSGNGLWSVISGTGLFSNASSPTSTINGLSIGANVLRWTISSGSCGSSFSDLTIFVEENPSLSQAGSNQLICGSSTNLAANTPLVGIGAWSKISGSGTVVSVNSPTSQVIGLNPGTSVFQWSISNGVCPISTSTVSITVSETPTPASAGSDQVICGNSSSLSANAALVGSGVWSVISGSGVFSNPNSETSLVSGLSLGNNILRWTISNAPCTASFDELIISVSSIPEVADAGPDQLNLCGITSTSLSSNAPIGTTTAAWSVVSGSGGSFSNPLSPTTSFSGIADSSYVLRWTISSSGCSDSFDDVFIQFKSLPMAANAGVNQRICENMDTVELAANQALGATGLWTLISGSGNFINSGNETTAVTGFSIGINEYQWSISNSCGSSFDTITVLVDALPSIANAGFDQTFCSLTNSTTLAANPATVGTGSWMVSLGSGLISNSSQSNSAVTSLSLGTNVLVWSIGNGVCPISSDSVSIILDEQASLSVLGNDTTICNNQITLSGNAPSIGMGSWSIVSGSGTILDTIAANTSVSGLAVGNNILVWKISNGTCPPQRDTIQITTFANPSISDAGANQITCLDSTLLTGNSPLVGTGSWSLVSGSGTIVNPSSPTTSVLGLSVGSSVFQWTISNGVCASDSSQVTITVIPPTSVAFAGLDDTLCGNSTTLNANPVVVGIGLWSLVSGAGTIVNASSSTTLVTGLGLGKNIFEWRVSSTNCYDTFDSVAITVTSIPVAANAGADQLSLCGLTSTSLAADTTNQANGSWSIISGGGGSFSSLNDPHATFSGLTDSSYVLRWTISDPFCSSSFDDVLIRFDGAPSTANAGADRVDASTCGITSLNLAANTAASGTTNWTILSGTGGTISSNLPTALFTGIAGNTYVLEWSIGTSCGLSKDTVIITLNLAPSVANAGVDQAICESTTSVQLNANTPTNGLGNWTVNSGSGSFSNTSLENSSLNGLSVGNNSFVWTISSNLCGNTSDTVNIVVGASPTTALAGTDQNSCIDAPFITLYANVPSSGTGQWISINTGLTFSNANDPQSQVSGLGVGVSSFVWEVSASPLCPVSTDTVAVLVSALPSAANAGNDLTICENTASSNLSASVPLIGNGLWSVGTGTATFLNNTSANTAVGNFSLGVNELIWTVTNGACASTSDSVLILVNEMPNPANAGLDQQVCESADTIQLVGNSPNLGNGHWDLVSGVALIDSFTNDSTLVSGYSVGSAAFTWTITNGACSSVDTVNLLVDALPTTAFAGFDKSVCNPYALLKADTALIGTGSWSVASGSTGVLLHPTFDTTAVVGMSQGQNTFIWTISNGICASSVDSVTITVNPAATIANAGPDQNICVSQTQAFLSANIPTNGIGNWKQISGSGLIADTSSASTTVSGLSVGVNIFTWIIKNGTCSSFDNVKITVSELPSISIAGIDQTVCENSGTITLSANAPAIGTGVWSGPGIFTDSLSENSSVTGLNVGDNPFVWSISNGACLANADTVHVFVDALPSTAFAGNDQAHCINQSGILLQADSALIGAGVWTTNGSANIVNSSLHNSAITNLSSGTTNFVWTVSNGVCPASSDTVSIHVDELPTSSLAGADQEICDTFSVFNANIPSIGVGNWSTISGTSLIANTSAATSAVSGLSIGANEFIWSISNGACPSSNDTVKIIVASPASIANAGIDQSVCVTTTTNSLSAVVPAIGSGSWTSLTAGAIINNPSLPNSLVSNLSLGINSFVWTVSNGLCATTKDTVSILLSDSPTAALVGNNQVVCENAGTVSINANTPSVGIGQWSVVLGAGSILNPLQPTSNVVVSKGLNSFVWIITNGACPASKDTLTVSVDSLPPLANAGSDQSFCENSSSINLSAAAIAFGVGNWSSLSSGIIIVTPNLSNSVVSGLPVGQTSFIWTTSNGVCPTYSDTTRINIDASPSTSSAGTDQTLCDTSSSTLLNANIPITGNGIWLPILGSGTLSQASNPNTSVSGLVPGIATFEWVISNGACPASRDTLRITVSSSPSAADAGADQTVCENIGLVQLNANTPAIGVGAWSLDNGSGTISSLNLPNATLSGLGVGTNVFRWTITNGSCKSMATVNIIVDALPSTADAGQDLTVSSPTASLNAAIPLSGTGMWSIAQGTGNFEDPNLNSSSITNLTIGTTVLTWTVSNGTCPSSTDELQITYLDLQIPNAISPNNDGINDAFVIPGLDFYNEVKFTVYNSWGNIVYHSNNYKNDFSGKNDSGQELLDDTYYYILQINTETEYKGYLIIKK